MKTNTNCYRGYRFPPKINSHGVWLYHRFCLSFRDVEERMVQKLFRLVRHLLRAAHYRLLRGRSFEELCPATAG